MLSHSSHINHEFLILVRHVTNVSSAIESFAIFSIFSTSKILVSFIIFNMANLLQVRKKQVGKMRPKSSKTLVKDKTPVKF